MKEPSWNYRLYKRLDGTAITIVCGIFIMFSILAFNYGQCYDYTRTYDGHGTLVYQSKAGKFKCINNELFFTVNKKVYQPVDSLSRKCKTDTLQKHGYWHGTFINSEDF